MHYRSITLKIYQLKIHRATSSRTNFYWTPVMMINFIGHWYNEEQKQKKNTLIILDNWICPLNFCQWNSSLHTFRILGSCRRNKSNNVNKCSLIDDYTIKTKKPTTSTTHQWPIKDNLINYTLWYYIVQGSPLNIYAMLLAHL